MLAVLTDVPAALDLLIYIYIFKHIALSRC